MIKNAKIGDRIQVINPDGKTPRTNGYHSYQGGDESGSWEFAKGNTGTVVEVRRFRKNFILINVRPDPPNFGSRHSFRPSELIRL